MSKDIIIVDGFYNNPDGVRSHILNLDYPIKGNYPGLRSGPEPDKQSQAMRNYFGTIMGTPITFWPSVYNTAYQLTVDSDVSWIHHDDTEWAAVVYLTPDAPLDAGTTFYRLKSTGVDRWDRDNPDTDYNTSNYLTDESLWERTATVGNVFNRAVIFRGELYHRSDRPGFGTDVNTGRITQTFFFRVTPSPLNLSL